MSVIRWGVSQNSKWRWGWRSLLGAGFAILSATIPVQAAEQIQFSYGLLEADLSVDSLEAYAQTGTVDSDLAFYFQFLNPDAEVALRNALQLSHKVPPSELSQMLYGPMGEASLYNLGTLIQTESSPSGFYALRAALLQSAAEPEGLSVLGVLRHFPSPSLRVDVAKVLQLTQRVSSFTALSREAVAEIRTRAQAAAAEEPIPDSDGFCVCWTLA